MSTRGLWRYPMKSMAGVGLASAGTSWAGLGTSSEFPEMSHYVAALSEPARPDRSRVTTSEGVPTMFQMLRREAFKTS